NPARPKRSTQRTTRRDQSGREGPDGPRDHLATTGGSGRIETPGPPDKRDRAVRLAEPRTQNRPSKPPGRRPGPPGEAWFRPPRVSVGELDGTNRRSSYRERRCR